MIVSLFSSSNQQRFHFLNDVVGSRDEHKTDHNRKIDRIGPNQTVNKFNQKLQNQKIESYTKRKTEFG